MRGFDGGEGQDDSDDEVIDDKGKALR